MYRTMIEVYLITYATAEVSKSENTKSVRNNMYDNNLSPMNEMSPYTETMARTVRGTLLFNIPDMCIPA